MTDVKRMQTLLNKHASSGLSKQEWAELQTELANLSETEKKELANFFLPAWELAKAGLSPSASPVKDWNSVLASVMDSDSAADTIQLSRRSRNWKLIPYAAALIILLGSGFYVWYRPENPMIASGKKTVTKVPAKILPGSNKAFLTLSNGSSITLDDAANGSLAQQGGTQVIKLANGGIVYKAHSNTSDEMLYNTINVPRGGQYQLTLPDGTKVWLNSASSLRYPVAFKDSKRVVELSGEGYFEVASNKKMPFHVLYKELDVQVLGTHFDIMAYEDESSIQTTLLEGSVRINRGASQQLLTPGKQAELDRSTQAITVKDVAVEQSVAWKNGYFYFNKADVKTILRQVSRWYDLDIKYTGSVSKDLFSGKIERSLPLESILRLLEQGNIRVNINGKLLTVTG